MQIFDREQHVYKKAREHCRTATREGFAIHLSCKYSQLHLNVQHDHEHDYHTTSRHQPTHKGLALCHRVILDSVTHPRVPARTPTVHGGPYAGRPWVARQQVTTYDTTSKDNTTKTGLSQPCFQETSVDTHLETYISDEKAYGGRCLYGRYKDEHIEKRWPARNTPWQT